MSKLTLGKQSRTSTVRAAVPLASSQSFLTSCSISTYVYYMYMEFCNDDTKRTAQEAVFGIRHLPSDHASNPADQRIADRPISRAEARSGGVGMCSLV